VRVPDYSRAVAGEERLEEGFCDDLKEAMRSNGYPAPLTTVCKLVVWLPESLICEQPFIVSVPSAQHLWFWGYGLSLGC